MELHCKGKAVRAESTKTLNISPTNFDGHGKRPANTTFFLKAISSHPHCAPGHDAHPLRVQPARALLLMSSILRGITLHMTCKSAQQVRLLLQVIQSMLQHVANADHADQPIAFFHGQMADVAGQHG